MGMPRGYSVSASLPNVGSFSFDERGYYDSATSSYTVCDGFFEYLLVGMQGFEMFAEAEFGTIGSTLSVQHSIKCPADFFGSELSVEDFGPEPTVDSVLFKITGSFIKQCYVLIDILEGTYSYYCAEKSGSFREVFKDREPFVGKIDFEFAAWSGSKGDIQIMLFSDNITYQQFLSLIGK
jgi:hypothetical protein